MTFFVSEDGTRDHARAVTTAECARLLFESHPDDAASDPLAHLKRGRYEAVELSNDLRPAEVVVSHLGVGRVLLPGGGSTLMGVRAGARWAVALLNDEQRAQLKAAL